METAAPRAQSYSLPSSFSLFDQAFSFYAAHWQVILGVLSVPVGIGVIEIVLGEMAGGLDVVFGIIGVGVGFLSRVALFDVMAESGNPVNGILGAYQQGWRRLVPFLWVSGLATLTTLGGFFLFFLPGIMLSVALGFSLFVFFSEEKRGIAALVASWSYVKGRWFSVFLKLFVFGIGMTTVVVIVSILIYGQFFFSSILEGAADYESIRIPVVQKLLHLFFIHFFLVPLGIIYPFFLYRALKESANAANQDPAQLPKIEKKVKAFMFFGIAVLVVATLISVFFLVKLIPQFTPLEHRRPLSAVKIIRNDRGIMSSLANREATVLTGFTVVPGMSLSALGAFLPSSPLFDLLLAK